MIFNSLYKERISWILIQRIKQSFLSKIVTGISISIFVISSLDKLHISQYFNTLNFKLTFIGGLLFVVGYIIATIFAPDEFRDASSLNGAVVDFKNIEYKQFYESRVNILNDMLVRFTKKMPFDANQSSMLVAHKAIEEHNTMDIAEWNKYSSAIYLADLNLRQFDRPISRVTSFLFFAAGGGLTIISTIIGAWKVLVGII